MDPVGIASLAYDVTRDLYEYYRTWKDCEKDVADLREQLLWQHQAFRVAREVARKPNLSPAATDLLYTALGACNDAANDLRDSLEKIRKQETPQTAWGKLKAQGRKASYPFRKATVTGIKANLDDCRDELHMAANLLQLDTTVHTQEMLRQIDSKLATGFEAVDTALGQLPVIASDVVELADRAKRTQANTEAIQDLMRKDAERQAMSAMLDWFCATDYSKQQNDFYAKRQEGTGTWFLDAPEFQAWLQGTNPTLVCPGQPGAGKTTMAATVIHHLFEQQPTDDVGIAYVFCNYKRQEEQNTSHVLGALVRQLLYRKAKAPTSIQDLYKRLSSRNARPSLEELRKAFLDLAGEFIKVHIVIDALDECRQATRSDVLSLLESAQCSSIVRLLVTTRDVHGILQDTSQSTKLEVRASDADVEAYLRAAIGALPRLVQSNQDLQDEIIETLVSAVDGMFLLAKLNMDSMQDKRTLKTIRAALANLPHGSDPKVYATVYEQALARICSQPPDDAELAKEALSWIARSRRRLTPIEFQHALAVELDDSLSNFDEDNILPIEEILSLCAGLITWDESSDVIRLVHYTAQSFFEDHWRSWLPKAETTIALKCIKYLSVEPFHDGACETRDLRDWGHVDVKLDHNPLAQYCLEYWADHTSLDMLDKDSPNCRLVKASALRFLRDCDLMLFARGMMYRMFPPYSFPGCEVFESPGVHVLAHFDAPRLMELLLETGADANSSDSQGRTALSIAAAFGHVSLVELFLGIDGVDPDRKDSTGRTPLAYAAGEGHEQVMKMLLATGVVDINAQEREGFTPIQVAASIGASKCVKMLLDHADIEVNLANSYGDTPIALACIGGHTEAARLLLEDRRVQPDWMDNLGRTPLSWASQHGLARLTQLLLGSDRVNPDSRDEDGMSPAHQAGIFGRSECLQLLLDTGRVEINSRDGQGNTLFHSAASHWNEEPVRLLLDRLKPAIDRTTVNGKNDGGETPLHIAVTRRNERVVRLILEHRQQDEIDVNAADETGSTPLHRAAYYGNADITSLLLGEDCVERNATGNDGCTPLHHAAYMGHKEVVSLLMQDERIHVNATADNGRTPLHDAAYMGREEVVSLFMQDDRVYVNATADGGMTPFHTAADRTHDEVVSLLLQDDRIYVNATADDGRTALHLAVACGPVEVVSLLIQDDRVNVNATSSDGSTPLHHAAYYGYGHGKVVSLLLQSDSVDVNARDNIGRSPLHWAAVEGRERVVSLLLGDNRVNINETSSDGSTPLHQAAYYGHGNVVSLLLGDDQVDIDATNQDGRTSLDLARLQGIATESMERLFADHRAHHSNKDAEQQKPDALEPA